MSTRTIGCALAGFIILVVVVILSMSLGSGHVAGYTYIPPGNVGLVVDTYTGNVEPTYMPGGTHYNGPWETVYPIPTMQRTISLTEHEKDADGNNVNRAVQVNTNTNMLSVDVSCQYHIDGSKARDLYNKFQDQFEDMDAFEAINLEPAVKEAVNYAIGDLDTSTALTTVGKQQAETAALKMLTDEWSPQGVIFTQFMIRGIEQDQASKDLLSTTLSKMQEISNAQVALQQQKIDNQTEVQLASADAKVNTLENSALTDLYVQDQLLSQVKTVYMPSSELLDMLKDSGTVSAGKAKH